MKQFQHPRFYSSSIDMAPISLKDRASSSASAWSDNNRHCHRLGLDADTAILVAAAAVAGSQYSSDDNNFSSFSLPTRPSISSSISSTSTTSSFSPRIDTSLSHRAVHLRRKTVADIHQDPINNNTTTAAAATAAAATPNTTTTTVVARKQADHASKLEHENFDLRLRVFHLEQIVNSNRSTNGIHDLLTKCEQYRAALRKANSEIQRLGDDKKVKTKQMASIEQELQAAEDELALLRSFREEHITAGCGIKATPSLAGASSAVGKSAQELQHSREEINDLRHLLAEAHAENARLRQCAAAAESSADADRRKISELEASVLQLDSAIGILHDVDDHHTQQSVAHASECAALRRKISDLEDTITQLESQRDGLQTTLTARDDRINQLDVQLVTLKEQQQALVQELKDATGKLQEQHVVYRRNMARLGSELAESRHESQMLCEELAEQQASHKKQASWSRSLLKKAMSQLALPSEQSNRHQLDNATQALRTSISHHNL
ncbi:hypothetical protein GQ42DRAFT_169011 [Ramicandelaber brevisporus]|nr:hypothetical protein GQ42DRAFT_169011 [Ramicandelaber brevisporus]